MKKKSSCVCQITLSCKLYQGNIFYSTNCTLWIFVLYIPDLSVHILVFTTKMACDIVLIFHTPVEFICTMVCCGVFVFTTQICTKWFLMNNKIFSIWFPDFLYEHFTDIAKVYLRCCQYQWYYQEIEMG